MTGTEATTIPQLVKDLRAQALLLEKDLRARSRDEPETATRLRGEYDAARAAERTAMGYTEWTDGRVTQAAAAWVLSTVFVRYCEDNGLIDRPFLAGPGERLVDAEEHHDQFVTANPTLNNRDWLVAAFDHISAAHPTAAGLFDRMHNPLWDITPSYEAANDLIAFWRRRDDSGALRYDFTGWDTRFLGDLYQDLSEAARKTYALLQTPEFVEKFILDLTLEPAVEEFGLDGLRTIDPASGSGHFLLGLFRRILAKWRKQEPGTDDWELIRRSLASVHGCDKNPFATSIARFRLLVAALEEAEEKRLDRAQDFPINVAVGDSLLHGRDAPGKQGELFEVGESHTYTTEDVDEFIRSCDLLGRSSYHVVVANPPYITVTDSVQRRAYKERYDSCSGKWVLSVPFAQRLFQLAVRGAESARSAGLVGQITANSFMKREFGKRFIESFLKNINLTHVIDTSGAYIPGHGTPTVILVGRNYIARENDSIRAVLGLRGEPGEPVDPGKGLVWTAITSQTARPASSSDWIDSADVSRSRFAAYPWTLGAGDVAEIVDQLCCGDRPLGRVVDSIGYTGQTNADDVFLVDERTLRRRGLGADVYRPFITGDDVRDFVVSPATEAVFPYTSDGSELLDVAHDRGLLRWMWPMRVLLGDRATFGQLTYRLEGRPWWEWHQVATNRLSGPALTWPLVQTHQHFAFLPQCGLHNRHAPIVKLFDGATEDEYLELLGVLDSSTACFWLKQVCHNKGSQGVNEGFKSQEWERFYEFTGTKLQGFPLPDDLSLGLGRELNRLARAVADHEPSAVSARSRPSRTALDLARVEHARNRQRMTALQEELDWQVYRSYGLLSDLEAKAVIAGDSGEPLALGERAFEIVLARKMSAGETETAWFARHRSTPITELPAHWSPEYRAVVEARIEIIENRRDIALIERPECKRRWASEPWEKKEAEALRTWLLDRCEREDLWYALRDGIRQPRTLTVGRLADQFAADDDIHSVAALYAEDHLGKRDMTLAQVLETVVAEEHVPFLAALRYKDSGLEKRAEWERTWEGQREEDRTGKDLHLPVPPKYKPTDFRRPSYWSQRGKLDVPKERFVSYPGASPDADPTLLLGWAGWDHKDQAQALVNLVNDRSGQAGWDTDKILPMLAGLAEVMPWVHQWHGEYDPEWEGTPAEEYQTFLDQQRTDRRLTDDDLRDWRPAATARGRRPKGST